MEYTTYTTAYSSATGSVDAFMMDVASRSARDQIARQMAAAQAYRRQQQSRICKPSSTGTSPQNVAWRRQVAGSRGFYQASDFHNAIRRRAATSTSGRPFTSHSDSRPVSWHPHSADMASYDQHSARHSMYEVEMVHQQQQQHLPAYQTVAMNGLPTPLTNAEMGGMALDNCFSLDSSPMFQQEYAHVPVSSEWATGTPNAMHLTPPSGSQTITNAYPTEFMHGSLDFYQQMMQMSGSSPATLVQSRVQTAPATPDILPIQKPEEMAVVSCKESFEDAEDDDGPELVGMGLYDSTPGGNGFTLFGSGNRGSNTLKLCDSWTPPEETSDDEEEADGDDDDDDDDEEEEEGVEGDVEQESDDQEDESEPELGDDRIDLQSGTQLPDSDLSNKTFFLDEAEVVRASVLAGATMTGWSMARAAWSQ